MPRKPAVYANCTLVLHRGPHFLEIEPRQIGLGFPDLALAQEEKVDDDVRARVAAEAALRQSDGGDQVGGLGDVLTRCRVRLVHRPKARDKGGEATGFQEIERSGDEVVMQPEPERAIGWIRPDGPVGEGGIADGKIVDRRQIGSRKVAIDDPGPRLQQLDDAGSDGIEFDGGDEASVAERRRHQGWKQARTDTRLEYAAPAPSHALQARPDRPDDELRREMGILRAASERRVVGARNGGFERAGEFAPAFAEIDLPGTAEHPVRQLGGAEPREADELRLLLRGGRSILLLDVVRDQDRGNIGAGAILPGSGQASIRIVQVEIRPVAASPGRRTFYCRRRQGGGRRGRRRFRVVVVGGGRLEAAECRDTQAKARRECAAAEHVESEGIVAHGTSSGNDERHRPAGNHLRD
ncbi:hypothetical protein FQZ97_682910 [compost metagenome]